MIFLFEQNLQSKYNQCNQYNSHWTIHWSIGLPILGVHRERINFKWMFSKHSMSINHEKCELLMHKTKGSTEAAKYWSPLNELENATCIFPVDSRETLKIQLHASIGYGKHLLKKLYICVICLEMGFTRFKLNK